MKRRDFLKTVPAFAAGGLLTACETVTQSEGEDLQGDLDIVLAGAEFEAFGVATYDAAVESGKVTDSAVADVAVQFRGHHFAHLQALNSLLSQNGRAEVDPASAEPDPRVATAANQNGVLAIALEVEFGAAQFYFSRMRDQLTTAVARNLFGDIMPVEVGHTALLKQVLGFSPVLDGALFSGLSSGL